MHDKFTDKEFCERFSTVAYNKALDFLNEAQELIGSAAQLFIIYQIYDLRRNGRENERA